MAGPIANMIQLPDDSGNTGKKLRTQTRVVGSNTVHEHFYTYVRQAQVLGVYRGCMAQQSITAAATNGTSTGFLWMHNPTATISINCRIRKIWGSANQTNIADVSAPRVLLQRFTFTGTASGAAITSDKIDTTFGAPVLSLRTASTGITVSLLNMIAAAGMPGALTAAGALGVNDFTLIDEGSQEDEWEIVKPGEGLVLYQDVAGTASDGRKFCINILWDEIDIA